MKKITFLVAALFATMGSVSAATIMSETFASGQGEFVINDVTLPEGGTYVWKADVTNGYMKASAYISSAAKAAESWLISPAMDLSAATSAKLTFDHTAKYQAGTLTEEATVWVAVNPSATFTASEWTQLTIPTYPAAGTWTFVSSGDIDLTAYVGNANVKVAFKYLSTAAAADTWEVKNVLVTDGEAGGGETGGETVALDVNYAQAQYLEEYSSAGAFNWEIDLINATSETDYTSWMYIDLITPTLNSIVGTWTTSNGLDISYSGIDLVNGTDTTYLAATDITLTFTYEGDDVDGYPTYAVTASMICDDGKTYTVTQTLTVYAFNATTEADLDMENASAISKIEVLNNVFANQGRIYTEDAARIYTITGLDVTSMNGNLEGLYIVKAGNKMAKVMVTK